MNPALLASLALLVGLIAGGVLGWVYGRKNRPTPVGDDRIEDELRRQVETYRVDLSNAQTALLKAEKAQSAAESQVAATVARIDEQRALNQERLDEQRAQNQKQFEAFKLEQERNLAQMREAFGSLSAEALAKAQPVLLAMANETLSKHAETAKGDLAQRQESILGMLKPVEAMLKTTAERAAQNETTFATAIGDVKKHLEMLATQSGTLAGETSQLRKVLGSSQARGAWGEETLRRVVEASGMSIHCDFVEQAQDGDKKPDLIVKLPGDRTIIVDSKVPDIEFLSALNESDDVKRALALKQHADKLKVTIKALADRDYPGQFPNSLDHVVLFVPAESLFSAALEGDRDLIVWAASKRIMLATPTSLIALLRSVSVSWQQHDQAVNAREIADQAAELFSRIATFIKHFESIRAGLNRANESYNDAVGSYERYVRPQGERVMKLGTANAGKTLPEIELLTDNLRAAPAAPNRLLGLS